MSGPATGRGAWSAGRKLAAYRPSRYFSVGALWAASHSLPVVSGLILKAVFDRATGHAPAGGALVLLAIFVAFEAGRAVNFWLALAAWPSWWQYVGAWLRANALEAVLCAPGPPTSRMPGSPGEAVGRLRDDVEDLIWFVDVWVDVAGGVVFTVLALIIMLSISPLVTLVVVLPLVAVVVATRVLSQVIRRFHNRMRSSGASVTALVADLFSGVLTLKTAGAERAALARFAQHNAERGRHAVRAQLFRSLLDTVSGASVDISVGLVLLLGAPAMRTGRFTVGDLALFTTYAAWLAGLPRWAGRMLARSREAIVALDRLGQLEGPAGAEGLLAKRPVELRHDPSAAAPPAAAGAHEPFSHLDVRHLTVTHATGHSGVRDASFRLAAGTFTVITGAVGAGKTTLIRGLLGLLPAGPADVRWNGQPVPDLGAWLVPPRAAYVGQIPHLLSDSLAENLALGWPATDEDLAAALRWAELGDDLGAMPDGVATVVGPRGSRLSGGQIQRTTLARALVRRPDLLIIDDVSSALDVETEVRLWDNLAGAGMTILAVSHRAAALERADRVIVLANGRVVDQGPVPELVARCEEFRRLWRGDAFEQAEEELAAG